MHEVNVLFTSAGRRVELLRAFRHALESCRLDGRLVVLDNDPLAPTLQVADRAYIVPRLDSPDYIPALLEICQAERVDIVFPLIDPDIPIMARHRAEIEATGARLAVVPEAAGSIISDKWQTVQFFEQLKLPVPKSWLGHEFKSREAEFPLFIKPRRGSAGKGTFKINDPGELDFYSRRVQEPLVQEFLEGPEITCDVICDLEGDMLAAVMRQRIEVRSGEVSKGITVYDPFIHDACGRIAQALPAIGPITVQCMMKDGTPHFTEINARFGGGIPLAIAAGVDAPALLLSRQIGHPITIPEPGSYQLDLYMTRYDDAFFLTDKRA